MQPQDQYLPESSRARDLCRICRAMFTISSKLTLPLCLTVKESNSTTKFMKTQAVPVTHASLEQYHSQHSDHMETRVHNYSEAAISMPVPRLWHKVTHKKNNHVS